MRAGSSAPRRLRSDAIDDLRRLILRAIGRDIPNHELDQLFKDHWSKLSTLAHDIHDGATDPPRSAEEAARWITYGGQK